MLEKTCSRCGYTFSQFKKTGLFGCPECYQELYKELLPTLRSIQKDVYHAGSKHNYSVDDKELLSEYKHLMEEKELAGIEGRFSDMASISEKISCVIEQLKGRGLI